MNGRGVLLAVVFLLCSSVVFADVFGTKKRMPRPEEYGNVVINNYSTKNNIAPVVFKHWLHRAKYTCRVCHVDIGFAMEPGGSDIKDAVAFLILFLILLVRPNGLLGRKSAVET